MRHHNTNRKFGLEKGPRKALMRSLVRSLVLHGKIQTTSEKAKELRPMVEKLVTRAKSGSLPARRLLQSKTGSASVAAKLIADIGPKYKSRNGGYTRIIKLGTTRNDGSARAIIEFV